MRTLAIGDIHGCSAALDALLDLVSPKPNDLIVTLGDYVDRGPDSAAVMNRLVRLSKSVKLVALRGNHEQMMMEARQSPELLQLWLACGGASALRSYAKIDPTGNLADVPDEHWDFLDHFCRDYYETPTHIFVHAGVCPDLPMEDQPDLILRWEQFNDPPPHHSGKTLVCGHTIQRTGRPRNIAHALCIDTGAFLKDGWLTCLAVEDAQIFQANQQGKLRGGWLEDYLVHANRR
jgi:serine/threonine protein phosphatase 1